MATDERELIAAAVRGDAKAYRELYNRYAGFVYNVALRTLRDPHLAEDALQETFAAAFAALGRFRGESRFKTWLYTIQYRMVGRLLATRGREISIDTLPDEPPANHPGREFERADQRMWVEKVLAGLPERDRMVLLLAYFDDLSMAEVAQVLEVTENHAKVLLFRARDRFRRHMASLTEGREHGLQAVQTVAS